MTLSEGPAEPSMLLISNGARPIHTDFPQWESVNSGLISRGAAASVARERQVGGVRKAFTRCAVNVGRAGRIKGPVAGDTRGLVQIAANGQSEGNLIAPAFASTE